MRFTVRAIVMGVAGAALLPAPAAAQDKLDWAAAGAGKVVYVRYCASCHGVEGKGDGPLAAELKVAPADLTRLAESNGGTFPFRRVVRLVDGRETERAHGTSDMPVWGEVFAKTGGTEAPSPDSAVSRIVHYIWSIQKGGPK